MSATKLGFKKLKITEEEQDKEWAKDWKTIEEVYELIEKLEKKFDDLNVTYLRDLTQKSLILNLKKYAWTLKGVILERYGDDLPDDFEEHFKFLNP